MSNTIELVAGGARSGKSSYALRQAEGLSGTHLFVATATSEDNAMAERISRHQKERGNSWELVEEPLILSSVLEKAEAKHVVLIDCLTLWITNWLSSDHASDWKSEKQAFITALTATEADVFLVTNEVGMGVVPMGQLTRDFVDEAGWLHQELAAIASVVTMVNFGIDTQIKGVKK